MSRPEREARPVPLVGTSWKMNKTSRQAQDYLEKVGELLPSPAADLFVLPPFTALYPVSRQLREGASQIGFGAQNVHWDDLGAFTGEVSAPMLTELGCRYVELNHQERRRWFGETDQTANWKVQAALRHGLTPILCLGEELQQDWPEVERFLEGQLGRLLDGVSREDSGELVLAYEPRWAIGAAQAASAGHVARVHGYLRQHLAERFGPEPARRTRIIYGGSVTLENTPELVALPEVDGLFIGRAALDPAGFAAIVQAALPAWAAAGKGSPRA